MLKKIICLFFCGFCISCNNSNSSNQSKKEPLNDSVIEVLDVQMADITPAIIISTSDSLQLMNAFKKVIKALNNKSIDLFKKYTFDSVYCMPCQSFPKGAAYEDIPVRYMPIKEFIKFYQDSLSLSKIPKNVTNINYREYISAYDIKKPVNYILSTGDSIRVHIVRLESSNREFRFAYYFVKIKNSFKFLGLYP